ncbi:P27 family phage terminase small subunit [Rhodococcus wratislaviensis]|uniref:P27 family phage terminase small subunit n=1 Tax=Rhodococcus wratislaviensis TaxID=44752 RepID=UPI0035127B1E
MPAAKPAALKLLNGRSPGRDSGGRKVQPTGVERGVPDKPADLTPEASAEWDRLVDGSGIRSWLKPADRAMLINLVETWSDIVRIRKMLRKNGFCQMVKVRDAAGAVTTKKIERPEVRLLTKLLVEYRQQASGFGLNPTSEGAASKAPATDAPASDYDNPFSPDYVPPAPKYVPPGSR